jgi:protein-S-isoprenylcysteine O-methyltransferase Ste14
MRFSNGTEFRFGTPKYSRIHGRLIQFGGAFFLLSMFIQEPAKEWIGGVGMLTLVSGLIVLLAGTIAERKEWQAAHKLDGSD